MDEVLRLQNSNLNASDSGLHHTVDDRRYGGIVRGVPIGQNSTLQGRKVEKKNQNQSFDAPELPPIDLPNDKGPEKQKQYFIEPLIKTTTVDQVDKLSHLSGSKTMCLTL
ncbi:hypothetical protein DPMN_096913 [Dreissena polymorpha]|uniref:Uncharacterized protein n=1 Tax=Dreissena polymorpha TaxID=45954 RepID=A0A9D4R573_DREPO|nr:hypothetical protein DPMN_096913 [Dreissena polymorpha]